MEPRRVRGLTAGGGQAVQGRRLPLTAETTVYLQMTTADNERLLVETAQGHHVLYTT